MIPQFWRTLEACKEVLFEPTGPLICNDTL